MFKVGDEVKVTSPECRQYGGKFPFSGVIVVITNSNNITVSDASTSMAYDPIHLEHSSVSVIKKLLGVEDVNS